MRRRRQALLVEVTDLVRKDEFDRNAAKLAEAMQQLGFATEDAADVPEASAPAHPAREPEGVPIYVREAQAEAIAELNNRATARARVALRRVRVPPSPAPHRQLMPANYGRGLPR